MFRYFRNILGLDPASAESYSQIEKFKGTVQPAQELAQRYLVEQTKLEVSMTNLTTRVAVALMPTLTKLVSKLAEVITEDNLKAFGDKMKAFGQSLVDADWESIRRSIDRILTGAGTEIGKFARDILAIVTSLNQVVSIVQLVEEN